MKVALPVKNDDISSIIDSRFGRAQGYLIVDIDSDEKTKQEFIKNPAAGAAQGAGVAAAQNLVEKSVDVAIVDFIGPNAYRALSLANVTVYKAEKNKTVRELLDQLSASNLEKLDSPTGPPQKGGGRQRRGA